MPKYEYACKSCGEHIEVVQSFTDDSLTVCPSCDGPLRKVFGNIGVVLKGSGFYKTDNRTSTGTRKPDGKGDAKAEGKSDAKGDGKSDTKADSTKKTSDSSTPSSGGSSSSGESKPAAKAAGAA